MTNSIQLNNDLSWTQLQPRYREDEKRSHTREIYVYHTRSKTLKKSPKQNSKSAPTIKFSI
jgi:hypothetical protein